MPTMHRRDVLKFFSSLPFVSSLFKLDVAKAAAGKTPPEKTPVAYEPELGWEEMAARLWGNVLSTQSPDLPELERSWMHAICYRFCRNLRNWELSAAHYPDQDIREVENVKFHVMRSPVDVVQVPGLASDVIVTALARKLRGQYSRSNDFSCGGLERDIEMCEAAAADAAKDVQLELRHHAREGKPVRVYALYMPPLLTPCIVDSADFSIRRGMRFRYAKVF